MRAGIEPRGTRWIAIRIGIVAFVFAAGFAVVAGRAVQLQVLQGDRLGSLARDQYLRELMQKPRRGTITDRNGAVLAGNAEADSIFVDPREFPAGARTRDLVRLAKALQLDAKVLERKIAKGNRFAWVKRRVSPAEADQVRAMKLPGVGFAKETRRYYPRRELAGQLIGIVGDDGEGLEGVEKAWDDSLQGEEARLPSLRDARGAHLLGAAPAPERALEGARVELTIDQGLQNAAERAVVQAVQQARAAAGMVVVVDPSSGEILALANAPLVNPNAPRRDDLRNRAILDMFEVGSTAKAVVISRALDEGAIGPDTSLFCENGKMTVGKHVIHDHKGLGWVPPARVMAASSNICSAKIGQRMGRERLQQAFLAYGFGERTGAGIPGEPRGLLPFPRSEIALANQSFGQGLTATPLQITLAMGAIANRGVLMKPWLVRRVVDPASGEVLSEAAPTPVRRVISGETAAQVTRWLEGVVADADGTGKKARIEGWRVAGKTGTAQKADPATGGYSADKRFSSFVGFVPADAPRFVIGVFVDEPKGEVYGGDVAAPVFREVAEYALKARGVAPAGAAVAAVPPAVPPIVPNPSAEGPAEREEPLDAVAADLPARRPAQGSGPVAVPAVQGLAARAALRRLEAADLGGDVRGSGRVTGQAPPAGAVVQRGTRVRLTLAPPG
ncbi:MAG TPA: penicillin-binding transpeptidase domain-containing protein [Anaeromyxobacteraceae bacterium]|nr:penicillin-binding transpeptidase domain-containing protein [Anaeromyxobacteraceae bacterium]